MSRPGRAWLAALSLLAAISAVAEAAPRSPKAMPREVREFFNRREQCSRLNSSDALDAAAETVDLDYLRCADLDGDEQSLRHRYRRAPEVLKALDAARG